MNLNSRNKLKEKTMKLLDDLCELLEDLACAYTQDEPRVIWEPCTNQEGTWPGYKFLIIPKSKRDCATLLGKEGANARILRNLTSLIGRVNKLYLTVHVEQPEADEGDEVEACSESCPSSRAA